MFSVGGKNVQKQGRKKNGRREDMEEGREDVVKKVVIKQNFIKSKISCKIMLNYLT